MVFMGVLCFIYLICSLRTNMVFVGILFPLPFAFGFLTAAYWYKAEGRLALASKMQTAGASFVFVTDMLGWYLFGSLLLAAVDFPLQLPGKFLPPSHCHCNPYTDARTQLEISLRKSRATATARGRTPMSRVQVTSTMLKLTGAKLEFKVRTGGFREVEPCQFLEGPSPPALEKKASEPRNAPLYFN